MFVGGAQTARERKPLGKHLRSAVCVSNWNFLFYLGILLQNYLPLSSSHNDLVMFALVIFFAKTQRKYRRVGAQTNIILPAPPNISINRMQTGNFNSEQIKRKYLKSCLYTASQLTQVCLPKNAGQQHLFYLGN